LRCTCPPREIINRYAVDERGPNTRGRPLIQQECATPKRNQLFDNLGTLPDNRVPIGGKQRSLRISWVRPNHSPIDPLSIQSRDKIVQQFRPKAIFAFGSRMKDERHACRLYVTTGDVGARRRTSFKPSFACEFTEKNVSCLIADLELPCDGTIGHEALPGLMIRIESASDQ
jgi:hypothetical protein